MTFDFMYSDSFLNNIDKEHLGFILIINRLCDAFNKKSPTEKVIRIIDELETYALTHFQSEERYYQMSNFPKTEIHIIKDNLLIEKLDECRKKFEKEQINCEELVVSVFNWLLAHLKNHEIEFNDFIEKDRLSFLHSIEKHSELEF